MGFLRSSPGSPSAGSRDLLAGHDTCATLLGESGKPQCLKGARGSGCLVTEMTRQQKEIFACLRTEGVSVRRENAVMGL